MCPSDRRQINVADGQRPDILQEKAGISKIKIILKIWGKNMREDRNRRNGS